MELDNFSIVDFVILRYLYTHNKASRADLMKHIFCIFENSHQSLTYRIDSLANKKKYINTSLEPEKKSSKVKAVTYYTLSEAGKTFYERNNKGLLTYLTCTNK